MFGRMPTSLGKPYILNLTILAFRLLPADLSQSAAASQSHLVTVWRASLKSHHMIGSLGIEQEDASEIHLYSAALVTKTSQVQQTFSTPLIKFHCPIIRKAYSWLPLRAIVKSLVSGPVPALLIPITKADVLSGVVNCLV